MKSCPYCAEWIQDDAIKCRYCREFLDSSSPPPLPPPVAVASRPAELGPWYYRTSIIVIALSCVGPLALPMVWWHPRMKWTWKCLITLATVAMTWACIVVTIELWKFLMHQWELLKTL